MERQAATGTKIKDTARLGALAAVLSTIGGDHRARAAAVALLVVLTTLLGADGASAGYRFP